MVFREFARNCSAAGAPAPTKKVEKGKKTLMKNNFYFIVLLVDIITNKLSIIILIENKYMFLIVTIYM